MESLFKTAWLPAQTQSYLPAAPLILMFAIAVISKLSDYKLSEREMLAQVFPDFIALQLAWLVPLSEIITILLLIFQSTQLYGFYAAAFLLTAFSIYIALGLLGAYSERPCPCAGIFKHVSYKVHLVINLLFLIPALIGIEINYDWLGLL